MELFIGPDGTVRCLYDEAIDLAELGPMTIRRASRVEPDESGHWWADMLPVRGPDLGPFTRRSEALTAERAWLEQRLLTAPPLQGRR